MSQKVKMRQITMQEATLDKGLSLYVMNRANPPGNINMTAVGDDGTKQTVVIPSTFIPVDMSNFISKENLLKNVVFRRLWSANAIILVNSDDAERAISADPRATKEVARLLKLNTGEEIQQTGQFVEIDSGMKSNKTVPITDVKPFAIGIASRSKDEDVPDLISELEARAHTLELRDFEYILTNVEDATLKQWIADYLQEQNAG